MKKILFLLVICFGLSSCRLAEVFYIRNYSDEEIKVVLLFNQYHSAKSIDSIYFKNKIIEDLEYDSCFTMDSVHYRISKDYKKIAFRMSPLSIACISTGREYSKIICDKEIYKGRDDSRIDVESSGIMKRIYILDYKKSH